jgi:hypothetical protein
MIWNAFCSAISHPTVAAYDGRIGGVAGRAFRIRFLAELSS